MPVIIFLASMLLVALGGFVWLFSEAKKEFREGGRVQPVDPVEVLSQGGVEVEKTSGHQEDLAEVLVLKEELRVLREREALQAENSLSIITDLRNANEKLKVEVEEVVKSASEKNSVDQESLKHFRAENAAFQESLIDKESEITRLRCQLADLQRSSAVVDANEVSRLERELDGSRVQLDRLGNRIKGLEAALSAQEQRNSALQYELTKSRAQAAGLERVYSNSHRQVEDLSRQVREVRVDNEELRRRSGFLGRSIDDFKRLNVELLKRERLSRFEEEKNREQVREIERIYDGVMARLSAAGLKEEDFIER